MPKAVKNTIGAQLQKHRARKGLSQAQFARNCTERGWQMTRDIVARIEARIRCVTDYELLLLSEMLGIPVPELLPADEHWQNERQHFV